jgi:hypothetical protein
MVPAGSGLEMPQSQSEGQRVYRNLLPFAKCRRVIPGSVTVRQAEELEGGALTHAEIKAIASGNPAVMAKVRVDTEIRTLDQFRSSSSPISGGR